ncbi:MAG: CBASS oligonucleotide cyclase [Bacteroidia bacterium]
MSRIHISHTDIANWAIDKVNLPKDKATEYREQANRLREKVQTYISEHPDFTLKKMLLSGSLAKGTALRSLNDIDIACYISGADAPQDIPKLLEYLAERLRKAFPNFTPDQVKPQTYCVTVSFKGSGLDVDIVPVLYYGDPNWYGKLVSQHDGSFLETCIPRHLEFIRKRKAENQFHFAQVIRLLKFWVRNQKQENESFKFKSFMVELILAKLADDGLDFSDYPEAMQCFFTYLAKSNLKEIIVFSDYYSISEAKGHVEPVRIIDPVNPKNNASKLYTNQQAQIIIQAALNAGDAIDAALSATTKEKTIYYWKKIFGPSFNI